MRKVFPFLISLILIVSITPTFASAKTGGGIGPNSFFYFLDVIAEDINLFFTFNPEKKARKAIEYANERIAEISELPENDKQEIPTTIKRYEKQLELAKEISTEIDSEEKRVEILEKITNDEIGHKEMLSVVFATSTEAVENEDKKASENQEKIEKSAPQKHNEYQVKNPVAPQQKSNDTNKRVIEELRAEIDELKANKDKQEEQKKEEKPRILTLPNGAVVEMDESGNIIRTIKNAPQKSDTTPQTTSQSNTTQTIQISSVNITPTITSAKIEWQTDKPTNSKLFLTGGGFSSRVYNSVSGLSTRHSVSINDLESDTSYSYEIEAISGSIAVKKSGNFKTTQRSVSFLDVEFSHNNGGYYFGSNCQSVSFSVYTEDQSGNFLPSVAVTFTNPETSEKITQTTNESNESRGKSAVTRFSYLPQVRFSPNKTQTAQFSAGSISAEKTFTIRETEFEQYPPALPNFDTERWEFVDMATTTYPSASHADRLRSKGYTKDTAWFSKRAYNSGGTYMYFDPDNGMCI